MAEISSNREKCTRYFLKDTFKAMYCIEAKGEYGKPVRIKCKNSVPSSFGTVLLIRSQEVQREIRVREINKRDTLQKVQTGNSSLYLCRCFI